MEPALGLARLVEAHALRVEEPAVVAAPDAGVLDLAEEQRRAPMHAPRVHEARVPAEIAEQDQVLAQLASGRAGIDRHEVRVGSSRWMAVRPAIVCRGCSCHARIVSPDAGDLGL